jgi:hypothetical protein
MNASEVTQENYFEVYEACHASTKIMLKNFLVQQCPLLIYYER